MGRERYWGGKSKSSKKGGGGGGAASPPSGCMCAVFQLFDFHQLQFALHHQQPSFKPNAFLSEDQTVPKGSEAPRNSFELEEPDSFPPPTKKEEDENLNIPLSGIQIKTRVDTSSSSEISSSPGTKTPNLVARLMGLDLLPDQIFSPCSFSPSIRGTSHNLHQNSRPRQQSLQEGKTLSQRNYYISDNDHYSGGVRSLPETPRISSARRSDVEHRLSLQINKENVSASEELVLSRISSLRRKNKEVLRTEEHEENRSPGHYARQIVKQVKENVKRKVGLVDISNTVRNNREPKTRSDDKLLISQFKSKKVLTKVVVVDDHSHTSSPGSNHLTSSSSSSCSPRLNKFLERKTRPIADNNVSEPHQKPSSLSASPHSEVNVQLPQVNRTTTRVQEQERGGGVKKCKKIVSEEIRFGGATTKVKKKKPPQTSDIIRNMQEEPFVRSTTSTRANIPVDKKCKKAPISNDLLSNISVPTLLLPLKKDPIPPATRSPQKQVSNAQESKRTSQLSCCSSLQRSYAHQEATHLFGTRDSNSNKEEDRPKNAAQTTTSAGAADECLEYISRILRRTGIDKETPVSFTRWFSPSHPLDPSIFYHLEPYFFTTNFTAASSHQLSHSCNRKLLFHLVDEILVQMLRPYINIKPWVTSTATTSSIMGSDIFIRHVRGSHLVDMLCTKVRSFPGRDCQVLEDIDALIDRDLPQSQVQNQCEEAFGEEGEGIVMEVEKDILDTLIHETTTVLFL